MANINNNIIVGLIDSGVNINHPHVGGKVLNGVSIFKKNKKIEYSFDTNDYIGHGTAVAAVICDVLEDVNIIPVKIFNNMLETDVDVLCHALQWLVNKPVNIINLSLSLIDTTVKIKELKEIILNLTSKQVFISLPNSLYKLLKDKKINDNFLIPCGSDKRLLTNIYYVKQNIFFASPWAKKLGNISKEKNFNGVSFSCSRLTGIVGKTIKSFSINDKEKIKALLMINRNYICNILIEKGGGIV